MRKDNELLRLFREDGSEDSFTEIVRNHLSLVYTVALRHVSYNTHLAEEVSQETFTVLAHKSSFLKDDVVLSAWLYSTARNLARTVAKREISRVKREQEAFKIHESEFEASEQIDWDSVRPFLDDAICSLKKADRNAIVLRFFEQKSFSEIGAQIGISQNTARMRVNRALDKLNALLSKNGIRSSATAVGVGLSTQAFSALPAGLGQSIASLALSKANIISAGSIFAPTIALMNTSKLLVAGCSIFLISLIGSAVFYLTEVAEARDSLSRLQGNPVNSYDITSLEDELVQRQLKLDRLSRNTTTNISHGFTNKDFEDVLLVWLEKADKLSKFLTANEQLKTPLVSKLPSAKWMEVVKYKKLETIADYHIAAMELRSHAKMEYGSNLSIIKAYHNYREEFDGKSPKDPTELIPFLDQWVDPSILDTYRVNKHDEEAKRLQIPAEYVLYEVPADPLWDQIPMISPTGASMGNRGSGLDILRRFGEFRSRFKRDPIDADELKPFIIDETNLPYVEEVLHSMRTPLQFDTIESEDN